MPAQTRVGDNDTGHDACPPRPLAEGSPDVVDILKEIKMVFFYIKDNTDFREKA